MSDAVERIAVLETNNENTSKAVTDIETTLHELNAKVGRIEIKLEKSMSFVGGIAFTFSFMGGFLVFIAGIIWEYVKSKIGTSS